MAAAAGGSAGLAALLGSSSPHLLIVSAAEEPAGGCRPDADLLLFATPQPARPGAAPRRPALGRPPVTRGTGRVRGGRGAARGRAGPCHAVPRGPSEALPGPGAPEAAGGGRLLPGLPRGRQRREPRGGRVPARPAEEPLSRR